MILAKSNISEAKLGIRQLTWAYFLPSKLKWSVPTYQGRSRCERAPSRRTQGSHTILDPIKRVSHFAELSEFR